MPPLAKATEGSPIPTITYGARCQGIELRDATWQDDVAGLLRRLGTAPAHGRSPAGRRAAFSGRLRIALLVTLVALAAATAAIVVAVDGSGGNGPSGRRASTAPDRRLLAAVPVGIRRQCRKASPREP